MLRPSGSGYRVGVVDPLTLVGKEVRAILRERAVPCAHIDLLDSAGSEEATLAASDDEPAVVTPLTPESINGLDVAIFCGASGSSAPWEQHSGTDVLGIDLTQPSCLAREGLPVVAGVNLDRIHEETRLLISPHPVAVPVILILDRLQQISPIEICSATVIQPASEFGQDGIDELFEQTIRVLNVQSPPKKVFQHQLAFNLYPAPGASRIEQYAAEQARAILGGGLPLALSVTQGTMFHSHTFSLFVKLGGEVDANALEETLTETDSIVVGDDDSFGTIDAGGRDEVLVSRISKDANIAGGYWIWAVSDNLRRSSALNAVIALEHVMANLGEPVN